MNTRKKTILNPPSLADGYSVLRSATTNKKRIIRARMNSKIDNAILILIASYCDLDTQNTVNDLTEKAFNKEQVHFFILDQSNHKEHIHVHQGKVVRVDPRLSEGVCWARNICQKHAKGFKYVFQIDAHMRVIQDWDKILINTYSKLPSNAIISSYPSTFSDKIIKSEKTLIYEPTFYNNFTYSCLGVPVEATEAFETISAPYICCCFVFTTGEIYEDFVFPPEIFFIGEEVAITLGVYTKGYDIFQMTKPLIWHNYLRENRSDFVWNDRADLYSNRREEYRAMSEGLASHEEFHWMGDVRTLMDYENEFGVDFATYSTVAGKFPSIIVFEEREFPKISEEFPAVSIVLFDEENVALAKIMITNGNEQNGVARKKIKLSIISSRIPKYAKLTKSNCKEEVESVFLIEEIVDPRKVLPNQPKTYGIKEV